MTGSIQRSGASVISVRLLCEELPEALLPLTPPDPPATVVQGVHISELPDPTPFLLGGELLLTTGLSAPTSSSGARAYVRRLRDHGVAALGFGVGPVHQHVPPILVRAAERAGLPLLVVPVEASFQQVTRAFWAHHGARQTRSLHEALGSHRRLVAAATSNHPVSEVLSVLDEAIGGQVALTDRGGEVVEHSRPGTPPPQQLRAEIRRLQSLGLRSAATFAVGEEIGSMHPISASGHLEGYLCTVSPSPLAAENRGLLLAALAILSLDAHHRQAAIGLDLLQRQMVAQLVDSGHLEAMRTLVAGTSVQAPPGRVRVLALASERVSGRALLDAVARALPAHGWWAAADQRSAWVLTHPVDPAIDLRTLKVIAAQADPDARATLGPVVELNEVHRIRVRLTEQSQAAPAGRVQAWRAEQALPVVTGEWAAQVLEPLRADPHVLQAVGAYLRHQGHWEAAARELGVHRNSVRSRIATAQTLLNGRLTDPDLAARVWIALRASGFDRLPEVR